MKPADLKELRRMTSGATQSEVETYVLRLARDLGVLRFCALCGKTIVSPREFSTAIVVGLSLGGDELDEALDEIEDIILDSGVETGTFKNGYVCRGHELPVGQAVRSESA
jgi:hypothetical protein